MTPVISLYHVHNPLYTLPCPPSPLRRATAERPVKEVSRGHPVLSMGLRKGQRQSGSLGPAVLPEGGASGPHPLGRKPESERGHLGNALFNVAWVLCQLSSGRF